jgi:hypothetical protein
MNSYIRNENGWETCFEFHKYKKCEEVFDVVRQMCDPFYVEQFCEIICEAYLADCDKAIKIFNKYKLDESNAYAFCDNKALEELLTKEIEAMQERELDY